MSIKLTTLAAFAALSLAVPLAGCSGTDASTGDEQNATAAKATFEVFQSEVDDQWYFHLIGGNGQILLRSEGYTKESSAKNGIKSVQSNGVDAKRFAIDVAEDGQFYFNLLASNGKVIGTSETYASKSNAERARDRVVELLERGVVVKNAELEGTGFQIFKCGDSSKASQFCFRLRAGNGEIVLQSESYKSESAAQKGVESVQKNGVLVDQYEVVVSAKAPQAWFRLRAESAVAFEGQQIIGRSQVYASEKNARAGIAAVIGLIAGGASSCLFVGADGTYSIFEELDHLEYGELVELNAESDFSTLTHNQIWAAVNHHFPSDFDDDEQDVFSFFDEDSLITRTIADKKSGRKYTALEFTSGDTPVATIFRDGSDEVIVLAASDQDVEICTEK